MASGALIASAQLNRLGAVRGVIERMYPAKKGSRCSTKYERVVDPVIAFSQDNRSFPLNHTTDILSNFDAFYSSLEISRASAELRVNSCVTFNRTVTSTHLEISLFQFRSQIFPLRGR